MGDLDLMVMELVESALELACTLLALFMSPDLLRGLVADISTRQSTQNISLLKKILSLCVLCVYCICEYVYMCRICICVYLYLQKKWWFLADRRTFFFCPY